MDTVEKRAEKLYWELNKLFSSEHNDSQQEQDDAIEIIRRALVNGTLEPNVITKMKQMLRAQAERGEFFKTKLSVVVRNKFWEKSFVNRIDYRPFNPGR